MEEVTERGWKLLKPLAEALLQFEADRESEEMRFIAQIQSSLVALPLEDKKDAESLDKSFFPAGHGRVSPIEKMEEQDNLDEKLHIASDQKLVDELTVDDDDVYTDAPPEKLEGNTSTAEGQNEDRGHHGGDEDLAERLQGSDEKLQCALDEKLVEERTVDDDEVYTDAPPEKPEGNKEGQTNGHSSDEDLAEQIQPIQEKKSYDELFHKLMEDLTVETDEVSSNAPAERSGVDKATIEGQIDDHGSVEAERSLDEAREIVETGRSYVDHGDNKEEQSLTEDDGVEKEGSVAKDHGDDDEGDKNRKEDERSSGKDHGGDEKEGSVNDNRDIEPHDIDEEDRPLVEYHDFEVKEIRINEEEHA
jgi:hypothetical protein